MALQPLSRLTTPTKLVLRQLVASDQGVWTGEVAKATDLTWGTADMVLKRLEQSDWLTSEREPLEASVENGRGVRRYWQLTDEGREAANEVLQLGRVTQQKTVDTGIGMDL